MFSPSLESSPHVPTHILQSQPNPPGQGLRKLLHERYRLSVSLQVYKLFCLFRSFIQTGEHSSQFDFYYWQVSILQSHLLCLACLTQTADSVLRAGWQGAGARLHFLSVTERYIPAFSVDVEMWEHPNVRNRFDVKTSKYQYSTERIATPFGLFLVILLNPASKTGLLSSCLGTVGVHPYSLPSGNVQWVSSFVLFGCKWNERNTQGYSSTLSFISFQLPPSWTVQFLMTLPFASITSTIYVMICSCGRFISDPQIVCEGISCCLEPLHKELCLEVLEVIWRGHHSWWKHFYRDLRNETFNSCSSIRVVLESPRKQLIIDQQAEKWHLSSAEFWTRYWKYSVEETKWISKYPNIISGDMTLTE